MRGSVRKMPNGNKGQAMNDKCLDCGKSIKRPQGRGRRRLRCASCAVKRKAKKERAWRLANPEVARAQRAKWRAANPEAVREMAAKWRANNPEAIKALAANWYAARRKNNPAWKLKNKRRAKAWRKRNAERIRQYELTRRPVLKELRMAA